MSVVCAVCKKNNIKELQACSGCRGIFYCGKEHQAQDWKSHKPTCLKLKEAQKTGWSKVVTTHGDESKKPKPGTQVSVSYTGKVSSQEKEEPGFF
jgi:hypothetical protein